MGLSYWELYHDTSQTSVGEKINRQKTNPENTKKQKQKPSIIVICEAP